MSKITAPIYRSNGQLFDTLLVHEDEIEAVMMHFTASGAARIKRLDNVLTIRFNEGMDPDDATAAALVAGFRSTQTVPLPEMASIESWLDAIGANANGRRIETPQSSHVLVWVYSIGGWIKSQLTCITNREEMITLKQWVLAKAGYLYSTPESETQHVNEVTLRSNGLNFVSYLLSEAELRNYPADMFRNGYVWLSPSHAYISIRGKVLAFDRKNSLALNAMRDLIKDEPVADAPVRKVKLEIYDWNTPEALALTAPSTPFYVSVDALRNHRLPPNVQVAVQDVESGEGIVLYINGVDFHLNLDAPVPTNVLAYCEEQFPLRTLSADVLPTKLYHTVYCQSVDEAASYYLQQFTPPALPVMLVGPYVIGFLDATGYHLETPRDIPGDRSTALMGFYQTLFSAHPGARDGLLESLLDAIIGAPRFLVTCDGIYDELVQVKDTEIEFGADNVIYRGACEHFADVVSAILASYGKTDPADAVDDADFGSEAAPELVTDEPAAPVLSLLAPALKLDVPAVAEALANHYFPSEVKAETQPGLQIEHVQLQDARKSLEKVIPESLRKILDAANRPKQQSLDGQGVKSPSPAADSLLSRTVSVQVVDIQGAPLYLGEFIFDTELNATMALERGFLSLVSTALGNPAFNGTLVATARIGQIPHLAVKTLQTLGLTGTVTWRRVE